MCTPEAEVLIQEVVTTKVDSDEMFTAFDVSKVVQSRQEEDGSEIERHRHLKNTIHQEMQQYLDSGLYQKSLHHVGAQTPAFLYHPVGSDPENYVPQHRAAPQPHHVPTPSRPLPAPQPHYPQSTPAPAPAPAPPLPHFGGQVASGQDGTRGDARGTLAVPCGTIRSVGLQNGETVYVSEGVQNGEDVLVLDKNYPNNGNVLASYTVDRYGNVRITHSTLSTLTDNGPQIDTFDFEVDGNTIVVSKN
jgi:hypothetical protein